jgi:hypothetical protein
VSANPTPSVPSPEMRRLIDEYTETVQRQMHLGSGVWTDEKRRVAEAALLSAIRRLEERLATTDKAFRVAVESFKTLDAEVQRARLIVQAATAQHYETNGENPRHAIGECIVCTAIAAARTTDSPR